jgi:UDP-glucose 4-epimerase
VTELGPVLVTGATGFVGRVVCAALVREGATVRGLTRSDTVALPVGVQRVHASDLLDRGAMAAAVSGVRAVIHLAGRAHVMRETAADPDAEYRRVNIEGTRAVLDAARAAGVQRFVLASSVKAVAESSESPLTERMPAAPRDAYGTSKLAAEGLVLGAPATVGATVLRFPLVYGAGVRGNMLRLLRLVDRGVPLPFGAVRNRRSLLFTGNLAAACIAVLQSPATAGETLFVSDGRDLSTPELVRLIAAALGRPARLWSIPPAAFRAAARIAGAGELDRLLGSLAVDSTRLAMLAGFHAPYTVEAGLRETAAWYRSAGVAA